MTATQINGYESYSNEYDDLSLKSEISEELDRDLKSVEVEYSGSISLIGLNQVFSSEV